MRHAVSSRAKMREFSPAQGITRHRKASQGIARPEDFILTAELANEQRDCTKKEDLLLQSRDCRDVETENLN